LPPGLPASPFSLNRYDSDREAGVRIARDRAGRQYLCPQRQQMHRRGGGTWNKDRTTCSRFPVPAGQGGSKKKLLGRGAARGALIQVSGPNGLLVAREPSGRVPSRWSCTLPGDGPELPVALRPWSLPRSAATRFEKLTGLLPMPAKATIPLSTPSTNTRERLAQAGRRVARRA
jgi:hypothetical protein